MKVLLFISKSQPLELREVEKPVPGKDEILLEMACSALNLRDVFITKGLYPGLIPEITLGSDGAGIWQDRAYLVNPGIGWTSSKVWSPDDFNILGMPTHGTFASYLKTTPDRLIPKPSHLSMAQAAALPLAGLTAYRLLFNRIQLTSSDRVCITGIGGGVALMAMLFALALGAEVWVTSSSDQKIEKAMRLGAAAGQRYDESDWSKKLLSQSGGFDVIIDSAGGPGFGELMRCARKGARIGVYGGTKGVVPNFSPQILFWKHLTIVGSSMGSDEDFSEMVRFVTTHKIVPVVDSVFPLTKFQGAFDKMDRGDQFGKIVLDNCS